MKVFFNGDYLEKDQVSVSPDDRGFVFADGVYEVMRWYGDHFLGFAAHQKRLLRSLAEVRIEWPAAYKLEVITSELIRLNQLQKQDALFYLQVTRGAAKRNHVFPLPSIIPTVYATTTAFIPNSAAVEAGIAVISLPDERWLRCDIKSIALLPNILAKQKASEAGAQEAFFIRNGIFTEGSHSNVFFVMNGVVYTHPESGAILSGITRNIAISLCRELSIPVVEEGFIASSLDMADEIFISNTSGEIIPVVSMDGQPVSGGKPGIVTKRLQETFQRYALIANA
jgi:D-alanine transaminase